VGQSIRLEIEVSTLPYVNFIGHSLTPTVQTDALTSRLTRFRPRSSLGKGKAREAGASTPVSAEGAPERIRRCNEEICMADATRDGARESARDDGVDDAVTAGRPPASKGRSNGKHTASATGQGTPPTETPVRQPTSVSDVIESQVLPRLVLSHRGDGRPAGLDHSPGIDQDEITTLAELVVGRDGRDAEAFIDSRRHSGVSLEHLYLGYLAPAARHLGALWDEDRVSFTHVTIGVGRLQQLQHHLSQEFEQSAPFLLNCRRILLAATPGEQHTFGLSMVASWFRSEGWDVGGGPGTNEDSLLDAVRSNWYDLVGFSVSTDRHLRDLTQTIRRLRRASRNRALGIIVGGPAVLMLPDVARQVGADAAITDVRTAPGEARTVVDLLSTN
jgi:methanogenic corrinoid protein MtbC1